MKAIMYHYVRPRCHEMPYFPFLSVEDFLKQLDFFGAEYGFVKKDDFNNWLEGAAPPQGVLLTFDDGLRDHHDFVLPLLEQHDLFGLFYIPSAPVVSGSFLDVHKLHLSLGKIGGDSILKWLKTFHGSLLEKTELSVGHYAKQISDDSTRMVKYFFNWQIPQSCRTNLLNELFEHAFKGCPPEWSQFYLDKDAVSSMAQRGMMVGAHGHAHLLLSSLNAEEQKQEILSSCCLVKDLTGDIRAGYSYAHGLRSSFNEASKKIVEEAGCRFAFAVEDRDIEHSLDRMDRYSLPRHNCNRFPNGQVSYDR